ncbi:MAG: GIY-YIG nuclease family protein [Bacteroidia bacterium]
MKEGWMYILVCADGSYYTGSTNNLELRISQHQQGLGANHTKKRLPVELVYTEEYARVSDAFYREKQVQGWSRKKKEALINGEHQMLPKLAIAYRDLRTAGFESLSQQKRDRGPKSVPEALEDTVTESLSQQERDRGPKSVHEALEGTDTEKLSQQKRDRGPKSVPEALEGTDTEKLGQQIEEN